MSRHRWVSVKWPFAMRELAQRLQAKPYSRMAPKGFMLARVRDNFLLGKFVERLELSNISYDPTGEAIRYDRVEFRVTEFIARPGIVGLEIIDPPKSLNTFISTLSEVCDDKLSIAHLIAPPLEWSSIARPKFDSISSITSIQISDIRLGGGVKAKTVFSGRTDVMDAAISLVGSREFIIEKIRIDFTGTRPFHMILSNSALATIFSDSSSSIALQIYESLVETLDWQKS